MKVSKNAKLNQSPRRVEKPEFAKGKKGLIICEKCRAVYCRKSWKLNELGCGEIKESAAVTFTLCPACKMIKNNQFEGEIIVSNLPASLKSGFLGLIRNSVNQAQDKDPLDRLIKIENLKKGGFRLTMTENQSAVRLAKKIKQTLKPHEVKISHSPSPNQVVYIKINF